MRKFLQELRDKYRWSWVGMVKGECQHTWRGRDVGFESVYWNLYVRADGKRRADVTGDPKSAASDHVKACQALVGAWKKGGPIPPLQYGRQVSAPPKAELIVFPGGKGDAA